MRAVVHMGKPTTARLGCIVIFVAMSFAGLAIMISNVEATNASSAHAYTILRRLPGGAEVRAYAAATAAAKLVVALPVVGRFLQSTIDASGAALIETLSADGSFRPASDELRPWSARSVKDGIFYWQRTQNEVLIDVLDGGKGPSEAQLHEAHSIPRASMLSLMPGWVPPATVCLVFLITTLCSVASQSPAAPGSTSKRIM